MAGCSSSYIYMYIVPPSRFGHHAVTTGIKDKDKYVGSLIQTTPFVHTIQWTCFKLHVDYVYK
jgi:hypothetical protein